MTRASAMYSVLAATVALNVALVQAQAASPVVSVFLPDADRQPLVGSIISRGASQTVLEINCPSGTDPDDCGFPTPVTVTQGPSTLHLVVQDGPATIIDDCKLSGTTQAVCTETAIGPADFLTEDGSTATSSNTAIITSSQAATLGPTDITFLPVTITAGAATGSSVAGGSTTPTGSAASGSSGSSSQSGGSSSTGTATASATGKNTADRSGLSLGSSIMAGLVGIIAMVV